MNDDPIHRIFMVHFLLYLRENKTLEVKADHFWREERELIFSLNGEVVARLPSEQVLLIDEVRPDRKGG